MASTKGFIKYAQIFQSRLVGESFNASKRDKKIPLTHADGILNLKL